MKNMLIPLILFPIIQFQCIANDHIQAYTINLMWINQAKATNQKYLYPSNIKNNFGKEYTAKIIEWAAKNYENTINIWFDSFFLSSAIVSDTQKMLDQKVTNVEFKDKRRISTIKQNPEVFSDKVPVYFRADLVRAIIAEEMTQNHQEEYFVYADFDIKPMSKNELFDKNTLAQLQKNNFVMAQEKNRLEFENSFQIFTYNKELSRAMRLMLIKVNMQRARTFLDELKQKEANIGFFADAPQAWKIHEAGFQENVFYSYPLMFSYFCQLQQRGHLTLNRTSCPYDEKTDGIQLLDENAKVIMLQSSALAHLAQVPMPTKKVVMPPSMSLKNSFYN
jgi:hypothetical protein